MKTQDWVIIGAVTLLIVFHFYLPFVQDNEGLHSAFFALKYANIHWGFHYFYFMISSLLIGLIAFITLCQRKYRHNYLKGSFLWFGCMIVMASVAIPLENFLKANMDFHLKAYANPSGIFAVSLLSLPIIALINLLGGAGERMKQDSKIVSNEKFESYLRNKKVIYKTTVYFSTKWYFIFTGIKPSKIALTSKEIVVARKGGYLTIPYTSIEKIKKNWGGKLNGGIFSPFKLILKNGTKYRVTWTVEGGMYGNYDKTMEIYDKVSKLWKGEEVTAEPEEKSRVSRGAYLRYMVYGPMIYAAIAIAKNIKITIATFISIGLIEYLIKNKNKIKKYVKNKT